MYCKYKNSTPKRRKSKAKPKHKKSKVTSRRRKSSKFSKKSNTLSVKNLRSARDLIHGSLHDVLSVQVQSILNRSPMTWNELIQTLKSLNFFNVESLPPANFRPQIIIGCTKAISEENIELLRRSILRGNLRGVVSMSFESLSDRANLCDTLIDTIHPLLTPFNFPILEELNVNISREFPHFILTTLPPFPNLINLYINNNPGIMVENFPSSLNILECNFCDFWDTVFSTYLESTIHLTKLHAVSNFLAIDTARAINRYLPALTDLNLSDNMLDDDAIQVLFDNNVTKLTKLDLSYNMDLSLLINPVTLTIMSGLVKIRELNLTFTSLPHETILAIFSQLHQLIKLWLDNMPLITNNTLNEIIGLNLAKVLPNLKYLSILDMIAAADADNNFLEEFALDFAKKLPNTKVYLSYDWIGDSDDDDWDGSDDGF